MLAPEVAPARRRAQAAQESRPHRSPQGPSRFKARPNRPRLEACCRAGRTMRPDREETRRAKLASAACGTTRSSSSKLASAARRWREGASPSSKARQGSGPRWRTADPRPRNFRPDTSPRPLPRRPAAKDLRHRNSRVTTATARSRITVASGADIQLGEITSFSRRADRGPRRGSRQKLERHARRQRRVSAAPVKSVST